MEKSLGSIIWGILETHSSLPTQKGIPDAVLSASSKYRDSQGNGRQTMQSRSSAFTLNSLQSEGDRKAAAINHMSFDQYAFDVGNSLSKHYGPDAVYSAQKLLRGKHQMRMLKISESMNTLKNHK